MHSLVVEGRFSSVYFTFRTHLSALELVCSLNRNLSFIWRIPEMSFSFSSISWIQQRFLNTQNRWEFVSIHLLYVEHTSRISWHFLFCWLKVLTESSKRNTIIWAILGLWSFKARSSSSLENTWTLKFLSTIAGNRVTVWKVIAWRDARYVFKNWTS